ncbi:hypothetical protein [uncultured Alsobacter sp.]|uniref:hypothetical protein n=1 Tax=uncultured Alsobacter sp. TaxID=1748258 RepID=UPI0025DB6A37|nr:hypothetical protein [uncultured Alsobacter sp.]
MLHASLACLLLGGCVTAQTRAAFDATQESAAARQMQPGDAAIRGNAFIHADTGRTYTAAGDWVTLIPVTAYAEERMRVLFGPRHRREVTWLNRTDAGDPRYLALTRQVKANIHSRFEFENVRPGPYFVTAFVQWQRADEKFAYLIYDRVEAKAGETTEVVLSGN